MSMIRSVGRAILGGACVIAAGSAQGYAPKWLACEGKVTTEVPGDAKAAPVSEVVREMYMYDDDAKNLFRRSEARKADDILPVSAYTDKEIRWDSKYISMSGALWEGTLDRASLALKIVHKDTRSTRTWTEQCKPAQPPG